VADLEDEIMGKAWALVALLVGCELAPAAEPGLERIGTEEAGLSQAVVVPDVPLGYTTQVLPLDGRGELVGKGDPGASQRRYSTGCWHWPGWRIRGWRTW